MSPGKRVMTPRKSRASKVSGAANFKDSPLKREVTPILEENPLAQSTTVFKSSTLTNGAPPPTNGTPTASATTTPVKKDSGLTVEIDEKVETNGDVETTTTHVKLELPAGMSPPSTESTEDMMAKAREMVAEARKADGLGS